ncbi:MAG: UDP-N-acetylglucosamine 2-epimerase (non-hydrolyzing) [Sphingomonas sp.]|nr:UDP-N-acetylglucosamine 2-epimerase (non-hydrolyzing) [Sphingomonas sp.]
MRFSEQRVFVVFGTRPEAIKLAPVVLALRKHGSFAVQVCATGQHRDMAGPVCDFFGITPDFDLAVMQPGQSLEALTAAILSTLPDVFRAVQPDLVIVQGDTATAYAAALCAFFHRVRIAHVEAGLRTFDLGAPWPEEGFRSMIGRLADYHFAPTQGAYRNLIEEGARGELVVTGNTVVDAARIAAARLEGVHSRQIALRLGVSSTGRKRILFTMHRRESFGDGVQRVLVALDEIARKEDVEILFPVHPNPSVREPAERILGGNPNVRLIEPLGYDEIIFALQNCSILVTDSGGLAEEAPAFGTPALILRESTERPECVECGNAILVGQDAARLKALVGELLTGGELYASMSSAPNPFGDGRAADRIATLLAGPTAARLVAAA